MSDDVFRYIMATAVIDQPVLEMAWATVETTIDN
jgi:hypothetical protein